MEAGFVVFLLALAAVISIGVGVCIGIIIKSKSHSSRAMGILNVDCSDPANGPYLYLELATSVTDVADHKQAVFDVRIIK